ncbi:ATP-dependent DNA helicase [Defluviimonas salinarum]|uniref:DEAD/DEAH box helicase n=1 Tax=Defluviimonas salinarum TaxID=2992147 RepID=A0ABT3J5H3_9RHOB|nr:DEAD/DEAH box helicase [Defluviimonas salinarum]MCW3782944.1 DEAD/DEAH box helicase [Defluviimonas salinarum]
MRFSEDQEEALSRMDAGESLFLTGGAGTGKSATIEEFVRRHPRRPIARLASTGAAAQLIGGQTVHSFFQVGANIHRPHELRMPDRLRQKIKCFQTLIIDEISMLRIDTFQAVRDRLYGAARGFGDFAGYQLIVVGDFAQLPPVITETELPAISHLYGESNQFAFQSRYWPGLKTQVLNTNHRQSEDRDFARWLEEMRKGRIPDLDWINTRVCPPLEGATHLVSTNRAAQEINARAMAALPGGHYRIEGRLTGSFAERDARVPQELILKPGARVIICANDLQAGYANGSTGTLLSCSRDGSRKPIAHVRLDNGTEVQVKQHFWESVEFLPGSNGQAFERHVRGGYHQLPLLPGWAITIHRSQGMSIDRLHVDPRGIFEAGQAYVALSRATRVSGLSLAAPLLDKHVLIDERVSTFLAGRDQVADALPVPG